MCRCPLLATGHGNTLAIDTLYIALYMYSCDTIRADKCEFNFTYHNITWAKIQ